MGAKPPCCPQGLGWYRAIARSQPSCLYFALLLAAGYGSRSHYGHQSGFGAPGNLDSVPLCLGMSQGSCRHSRHGAGNLHKSKSSFCWKMSEHFHTRTSVWSSELPSWLELRKVTQKSANFSQVVIMGVSGASVISKLATIHFTSLSMY